ncbi:hypothetical protein KY345_06290 [Candidatus Woesearchaeota archaeon]|nr:hypothetical protein [Candidatus Woesearchaeota archaeon]
MTEFDDAMAAVGRMICTVKIDGSGENSEIEEAKKALDEVLGSEGFQRRYNAYGKAKAMIPHDHPSYLDDKFVKPYVKFMQANLARCDLERNGQLKTHVYHHNLFVIYHALKEMSELEAEIDSACRS